MRLCAVRIAREQFPERLRRGAVDRESLRSVAMKHPDNVNRDIDDEVAGAIERRYAERLVKGTAGEDRPADPKANPARHEGSSKSKSGNYDFEREIEQFRQKTGF
jgi:hypothetical protein